VQNAEKVFEMFHEYTDSFSPALKKTFNDKFRKPLLSTVERHLLSNWRYHLNYYQFISSVFPLFSKDEQSQEIFQLLLKGMKGP